ncbi:MAG TPA: hypothetical protein VM238_18585 [Phycisphaerae bacterium]|nr:hypothetical protein [Phycisphaerae bacterium]
MKLDVAIWRCGRCVTVKVLYQDESLRSSDFLERTVARNGDWAIKSAYCPAIDGFTLWIRGGGRSHDNIAACYTFVSEDAAVRWCNEIGKLIDEVNAEPTTREADALMIRVR